MIVRVWGRVILIRLSMRIKKGSESANSLKQKSSRVMEKLRTNFATITLSVKS